MVYITGENDTLATLQQLDEFTGSSQNYYAKLCQLNRHINGSRLAPYTPVVLLCDEELVTPELCSFVRELSTSPKEERQALHQLQESRVDLPTLIAMNSITQELKEYTDRFTDWYDSPLISTPWLDTGQAITGGTAIDLLKDFSGVARDTIGRTRHVYAIDELLEALARRDTINHELLRLKSLGRGLYFTQIQKLEREARVQTAIIKRLLPKRMEDTLVKFLNRRGIDTFKARTNAFSLKWAKKGKAAWLRLDLLNKTGLIKAKVLMKFFDKLGSGASHFAKIGPAVVAYDTGKAWVDKKDYKRVFFSGAAGLAAGSYLTSVGAYSTWGAAVVGTLAGDAALGGVILASLPAIGTVVLAIVGAAIISYGAYKVSGWVQELWDSDIGKEFRKEASDCMDSVIHFFKQAWDHEYNTLMRFFGNEEQQIAGVGY